MDSTAQEKLIQSLEHDVDYSPWQRKKVPVATVEKERYFEDLFYYFQPSTIDLKGNTF